MIGPHLDCRVGRLRDAKPGNQRQNQEGRNGRNEAFRWMTPDARAPDAGSALVRISSWQRVLIPAPSSASVPGRVCWRLAVPETGRIHSHAETAGKPAHGRKGRV